MAEPSALVRYRQLLLYAETYFMFPAASNICVLEFMHGIVVKFFGSAENRKTVLFFFINAGYK